jgi:hypothetical protein
MVYYFTFKTSMASLDPLHLGIQEPPPWLRACVVEGGSLDKKDNSSLNGWSC